jgi:hypothetical protein
MKKILLVLFVFIITVNALAQQPAAIIKTQAMELARAMLKKDYNAVINYMHPKIITAAGGNQKLLQGFDTLTKSMQQFGVQIKKIVVGNPGNIIKYKNELQCVLPQTTTMEAMMGTMEATTTLIAISQDDGKHWYFIDTAVYNGDKLKKYLPGLSPQLVIPPMQQPKITPRQQ